MKEAMLYLESQQREIPQFKTSKKSPQQEIRQGKWLNKDMGK